MNYFCPNKSPRSSKAEPVVVTASAPVIMTAARTAIKTTNWSLIGALRKGVKYKENGVFQDFLVCVFARFLTNYACISVPATF